MIGSPKLQLPNKDYVEIEGLIKQMEHELSEIRDSHSTEIIRSLMQVLILKLFRIKSKSNDNIGLKNYHFKFLALQEMVEKDCFESKKVSYYAHKLGVTNRTLNNITQSVFGKPAKTFIDEIVILQIKRLLINSDLTFTEVAYEAGFDHPTNFFKYFRKLTGLTPKDFKENFR